MKSKDTTTISKRIGQSYLIIGSGVLAYAVVDKFFLKDIDNLGVALPVGLMFIILSAIR